MIQTEIRSGKYELLYSNRICCINNDSIEVMLIFDKNNKLSVEFKFNTDENLTRYSVKTPESGKITIELFNFKNPLGTGLKKPIDIANFNGKVICLSFNVLSREEANPIIDFSFFIGE